MMTEEKTTLEERQVDAPQLPNALQTDPNARPACFKNTFTEVLFVITATMAVGMTSFLTGGISVITSYIGEDLKMTSAEITWISAAPNLSCGAFLLFFGKVADLFGRKTLFVGSLFLFAVFALAAGFSKTGITLDVINGFMGLVSASAVPGAQGTLGVVYSRPSKRKNYVFACFSAGNPIGFVLGTLYSGVATQIFNWRSSFWFLSILYGVFTLIALYSVPKDTQQKVPLSWSTVKSFDIVGTVLAIGGIGMFSTALTMGSEAQEGWRTPYVLALLIVGLFLFGVFLWWETKFSEPLMPMRIWMNRDFSLLNGIQALGFMGFTSMFFWISLFFQRYWTSSPIMVAVYLLPAAIMGIIVNIVAGMILHKVSNKLMILIGSSCYTLAFLLMGLNKSSSIYWAFCFPSFIFAVWGADFEFNVANMYVMSSFPPSQQSVAGGIFQTVIRLCSTIGLGITTAIFNAVQESPPTSGYHGNDPIAPYAATFWFSTACSAASIALVPFLKIGTQGGTEKAVDAESSVGSATDLPRTSSAPTPPRDDIKI
ncbi:hypothetical protein FH972_025190 [Carpinus fangiana]|uniref:Major facilitator superfamily (MFS) profile domain-containing protein n=1 Tax=Carpinus fangiana TaxID=176857 RepID=A0A5N6L0V3_9ROSI|nr:hypothetical protein FH972_025190 [Carpinus fangiana]